MNDDAELVVAARDGDRGAFGSLAEHWFDRCWEVAWRILRDRDLAADVAQDTLLVAWQQLDRLQQPASFGGWVLRITRNRALDRLARERRAVPTADHDDLEPAVSGDDPAGPEAVLARAQEHDLVWAAAAALGERDASLLDLHLRHGLEPRELAEELQISPNAAHQAVFRLRNRLGQAVRAWLLWHDDDPACVVLRAELAAAGQTAFGATTVRTVRRHVAACDLCAEEHDRVVAPAALFSAVPLVAAPALLRSQALASLAVAEPPVADGGGTDGPGGSDGGGAGGAGSSQGGPDATAVPRAATGGRALAAGSPPVSRVGAGLGVVLVALVVLGGWLWWRTTSGPVVPAAVDQIASEVPADDPFDDTFVETVPVDVPTPAAQPDAGAPQAPAPPVVAPPPDPVPPAVPPSEPPPAPTAPEPPRITSLSAAYIGQCQTARSGLFEIVWASDSADTAALTVAGASEPVGVSGAAQRCAPDGTAVTVTVTGPGGSATRAVTAVVP